ELERAVAHRSLRGSRGYATPAEMRSERVAESVHINRPPSIVALVDDPSPVLPFARCQPRRYKIEFEDPNQAVGNIEQRAIGRQPRRNGLVGLCRSLLRQRQSLRQPNLQVVGKIVAKRNLRSTTALLVKRLQHDVSDARRRGELNLTDRQRR